MTKTVLLNNIDHHDLKVLLGHSHAFGDGINQALVFPTEFEEIQREYPIVFRKHPNGHFQAYALLGLDREENLFLDGEGWRANYVPALQQRGPFLIGLADGDDPAGLERTPMILVDLDHPRVGRTHGEPLFLPHGGNAPLLEHVLGVLRLIHDGEAASGPMFAAFEEHGLIEPVLLQISLDDTRLYDVPDCHTINAGKLQRLGGDALEQLNQAGFLRLAFMVAASLGNVGKLIELKNRKRLAGETGATAPVRATA